MDEAADEAEAAKALAEVAGAVVEEVLPPASVGEVVEEAEEAASREAVDEEHREGVAASAVVVTVADTRLLAEKDHASGHGSN